MNVVVGYINLGIWIVYFYLLVSREILRKNKNKEKYTWSLLKHDIFYLFRVDSLFFLIMFYIYKGFKNPSVTSYLYFVFVVSSLVFILYDLAEYPIKNIDLKKEKIYYIVGFILLLIPFIYYFFIKKSIANTFLITLIINFLIPIIIYLLRVIFYRKERS